MQRLSSAIPVRESLMGSENGLYERNNKVIICQTDAPSLGASMGHCGDILLLPQKTLPMSIFLPFYHYYCYYEPYYLDGPEAAAEKKCACMQALAIGAVPIHDGSSQNS